MLLGLGNGVRGVEGHHTPFAKRFNVDIFIQQAHHITSASLPSSACMTSKEHPEPSIFPAAS